MLSCVSKDKRFRQEKRALQVEGGVWQVREAQAVHWLLRLRVLGDAGETALLSVLNLTPGLRWCPWEDVMQRSPVFVYGLYREWC